MITADEKIMADVTEVLVTMAGAVHTDVVDAAAAVVVAAETVVAADVDAVDVEEVAETIVKIF